VYGTKEGFLQLYEELRDDILQELRVTFKMPEEAIAWQKDVRARFGGGHTRCPLPTLSGA
jgi:hypothetical protein